MTTPRPIQLLTNETIGKIAAGEVVERPMSAVKELLENAIDAGATRIDVAIANGGTELIEVADDGSGIALEDLGTALQRHATSKLRLFEDLDRLGTLGFRGEALPSIAAVSRMTLRSRTADGVHGASVVVDYGAIGPVQIAAAPSGTVVRVEGLFANVPARLKFLRQASTESAAITRMVGAYAAAYSGIQFTMTVDGRRAFGTDGSGDDVAAATGVFGVEVGAAALRIEPAEAAAAVPGVGVSGWVAAPSVNKSHRQQIFLFVNGRMIQSRPLAFALEEAYATLLMVGRHPVAMVRVAIDPALVDVNVHPTKAEVKFADERAVCRAVQRATHAALTLAPRDELPRVSLAVPGVPVARPPQYERVSMVMPAAEDRPRILSTMPDTPSPEPERPQIVPRSMPVLRVMGQVGNSYIVAEGPEGLYLIDQHAAHERVMYEKILGQMRGSTLEQQALLDPLVVDLAPHELAVFDRSQEELAAIGFEVEPFGDGAVVLRAVPAIMTGVDLRERFIAILAELADGGVGTSWLDSVAISAACHASIRANQPLSLAEMRELVIQLERCEHPRACGHGRPTMLLMSQGDLERQFQRR